MRVKVGDQWHEANAEYAVMIEMSDHDRKLIAAMPENYHYFAVFADDDVRSKEQKEAWMLEGAIYSPSDAAT